MKSISVIVPNYNYARFLKRRLDSIANQTLRPDEIIFLDDCSTDNSLEVAKELLPQYEIPYRIITNETNQGV
ncbi:MAG: glycosyltransferase family 2 protein, partial [Candidatus Taylorbacteria bacterium]